MSSWDYCPLMQQNLFAGTVGLRTSEANEITAWLCGTAGLALERPLYTL
jgi:hypothetical protein